MTRHEHSKKLGYGYHYRKLTRLGLPIIVGQLGVVMVSFADNIMIGHHSSIELAAASFVNNFLGLLYIAGMGFAFGLTPMVAESDQLGENEKLGKLLRGSIRLNTMIALGLAGVAILLSLRLDLFGLSPELIEVALPYYYIQVVGLVLTMLFCALKQFFDGMSKTLTPMIIAIIGNSLNVLFNYFLIYGRFGFPEWGLVGAGSATLAGRLFMLLVLLAIFLFGKKWRPIRSAFFQGKVEKAIYKGLAAIGSPVALQMGLEAASFSIAVLYVAKLGDMALAAHQIVATITMLGYLIYYGLGSAAAIHISHFRAEQNPTQIRMAAKAATRLGILNAVFVALLVLTSRNYLSYIFSPNQEIALYTSLAFWPVALYQFGDVLQVIYGNALRGMERVKILVPVALLCHVIVAPLLGYLFGFVLVKDTPVLQFTAIWSAFPISLTLMGVILRRAFNRLLPQESKAIKAY